MRGSAHTGNIDEGELEAEAAACWRPSVIAGNENPYMLTAGAADRHAGRGHDRPHRRGPADACDKVLELQERARNLHVEGSRLYNPGWHTARDIKNMLKVSEIIVRCALERKESRGAQWRPTTPTPTRNGARRT